MIKLNNILSSFNIVVVNYEDSKSYRILLYRGSYKSGDVNVGLSEEKYGFDKSLLSSPILLYISGYGVISKSVEQVDQIIADKENFIFSNIDGDKVCFVRKSQIESVLDALGSSLIHIECINTDKDVTGFGKDYYKHNVNWKKILYPDVLGSKISVQLYKKIKLYVLVAILGILTINFFVRLDINKKYAYTYSLLTDLQNEKGKQSELSKQQQDILKEFNTGINSGFASLGDQIGLAVSEKLVLISISIQPPIKRIEEGRPFKIEASKVIIKGESEDVSMFASRLRKIDRIRDIKISSMEKSRNDQLISFVIEIEI